MAFNPDLEQASKWKVCPVCGEHYKGWRSLCDDCYSSKAEAIQKYKEVWEEDPNNNTSTSNFSEDIDATLVRKYGEPGVAYHCPDCGREIGSAGRCASCQQGADLRWERARELEHEREREHNERLDDAYDDL